MSYVNYETLSLPDGTALTPGSGGNAVAPDYFDTYTTAPDGTVTFHAATKTARLLTVAGGGAAQPRKTFVADRVVVEPTFYGGQAWPGSSTRLIEVRNASDTSVMCRVNLLATGKVELQNAAGTPLWVSTASVPTNGTRYRVSLRGQKGTTTSNGILRCSLYPDNGASTTDSYAASNVNAGTSDVAAFRVGFSSGGPIDLRLLNVQWGNPADLAEFGPLSTPTTVVRTSRIVREEDFSSSTGSNTTVSAEQVAGPSVGTITIVNGEVAQWVDTTTRNASVTIRYTVGTAAPVDVTYPPLLLPSTQRLVSTGVGTGVWK